MSRVIIVEDRVYKASEKLYRSIKSKEMTLNLNDRGDHLEFYEYLIMLQSEMKFLGHVDLDIRL